MKAWGIIINRPSSGHQLSIPRYLFTEVVTSKLYVVSSALTVVGKLICWRREIDVLS